MATNGSQEPMEESASELTASLELFEMEVGTPEFDEKEECAGDSPCGLSLMLGDMPEEILEHILGFLSPYKEMEAAKLVSKQWNRVIKSAIKQRKRKFYQSLARCDVHWTEVHKDKPPSFSEKGHIGITDRFSHSTAYHDGFMYVFGGCTSTSTTFNDLWSFDLTHRRWVRPVAMGTYPSPKACATMVVYNGNLVLYGGWSHPIPYPLHQSAHYFSELHMYSPSINRWAYIHSLGQEPEALGGHSASVVGHLMVVFGGSPRPGMGTNNLWVFNFQKTSWTLQPVACDAVPEPRYGQFQTTLDDQHILIMGGCVGQNRVYTDVWLLTLEVSAPWRWTKLTVECPELAAPQTWCHAACRVNNLIVVVAKSAAQRQTKLVHRGRRKRQDRGRSTSMASASPPSSSPSPPDAASRPERFCTVVPASGSSKRTVYIHPKLQPQPKRGTEPDTKHSKTLDSVGEPPGSTLTGGTSATGDEAVKLKAAAEDSSHLSDQSVKSLASQPQASTSLQLGPGRSSLSLAEGVSTYPGGSQQEFGQSIASGATSSGPPSNSLLALQQRLHRECLNLPDPDNHHHNPRQIRRHSGGASVSGLRTEEDGGDEDDSGAMPEGYFHRLQNRWMSGQNSGNQRSLEPTPSQAGPVSLASPLVSRVSAQSVHGENPHASESLVSDGASCRGASHGEHPPEVPPHSQPRAAENTNSSSSPAQLHVHHNQPQAQFHASRLIHRHPMPSIRPNATSNRQRQLEALQRQEELLRSKSRALAAARVRQPQGGMPSSPLQPDQPEQQQQNNIPVAEASGPVREAEQRDKTASNRKSANASNKDNVDEDDDDDGNDGGPPAPTLTMSKNKMDVHVLDISRALSDRVVRWGPLSELQPPGAPDETICCSLIAGRAELALFGGVRRDLAGADLGPAGVSNMAVSRLYLLGPGSL